MASSAQIKNGELHIKPTPVFFKNRSSKARTVVNQGSTGSGKTYAILQNEILVAMNAKKGHLTSITAPTMPHLKKGALRDFEDIMVSWEIYDEKRHHKTDQFYTFPNGAKIEFFALDDAGKARGPRRNRLYINECNLIDYNIYDQLTQRTKDHVVIDYNPVDSEHWIYDKVISDEGTELIISTYKDNPYLSKGEVTAIEKKVPVYKMQDGSEYTDWDLSFTDAGAKDGFLISGDPNNWRVYGLGQRGVADENIYVACQFVDEFPTDVEEVVYGLDFGYNVPSSLVKVGRAGDKLYWKEVLYEAGLTNTDLIEKLHEVIDDQNMEIYADAAEPDRIDEIYRAGFNVFPADKSVTDGIDRVKSMQLHITEDSHNLKKERSGYKWKVDKNGNRIDEPVKKNDHALDAARYATYTAFREDSIGFW